MLIKKITNKLKLIKNQKNKYRKKQNDCNNMFYQINQ
jgi:hypothetical protein